MHTKNESSILYRNRENHFSPKPDIHTYRRTDISVYRVASLLKSRYGDKTKVEHIVFNSTLLVLNPAKESMAKSATKEELLCTKIDYYCYNLQKYTVHKFR